jgi:hypothetical protein
MRLLRPASGEPLQRRRTTFQGAEVIMSPSRAKLLASDLKR